MINLFITSGYALLVALLFMTFIFAVAKVKNRFDLIDVAWGLTFIAISIIAYTGQEVLRFVSIQTLVLAVVFIWGTRLSFHIFMRWNRSKKEDYRYVELRKKYAAKKEAST